MKTKKVMLSIMMISIVLMCIPTEVFAWLRHETYEACNVINVFISMLLRSIAIIISISYITGVIAYIRYSKQQTKQKVKNILIWLIITTIQIAILMFGALWVTEVGMEEYWLDTGIRNQVNEIDGYISNSIRTIALLLIIAYVITSINYFVKSKQENRQKFKKLVKWQAITATIIVVLLNLATNW